MILPAREQPTPRRLTMCQHHTDILCRYVPPENVRLLLWHVFRLFVERQLSAAWLAGALPIPSSSAQLTRQIQQQVDWTSVAFDGCPLCADLHDEQMMARAFRALDETCISLNGREGVSGEVMGFMFTGKDIRSMGALVQLHVQEPQVRAPHSAAWWN